MAEQTTGLLTDAEREAMIGFINAFETDDEGYDYSPILNPAIRFGFEDDGDPMDAESLVSLGRLMLRMDDQHCTALAAARAEGVREERARCAGIARAAANVGLSDLPRRIAEIIAENIEDTPPATGARETTTGGATDGN